MRYTPYTEAQIQSMNVLEEGTYKFQVGEVILNDKFGSPLQDKNGNDLAKLKLLVKDNEGRDRIVYTFLSGDGNFAYKLRHFCQTLGMIEDYENGTFNIMRTLNKFGTANVIVKKGTTKPDGSGDVWPDRNEIKDFVITNTNLYNAFQSPTYMPAQQAENPLNKLDDDIPF